MDWQRKTGPFGISTHSATTATWKFVADSPYRGTWVLRGWKDGSPFSSLYREFATLRGAKAAAQAIADGAA